MTTVFSALATSIDGYITGPHPNPDQPLGAGGAPLFDWYTSGDTPSTQFPTFRLSAQSAVVFDAVAARSGAIIAGRKTYDDSRGWDGGGPHPSAPLFVLSHRPPPPNRASHTFVSTGIADAVRAAMRAAGDKDVALMGSGVVGAALDAGMLDEVIVHQVPILLGGGVAFFGAVTHRVQLALLDVIAAPDVTHMRYRVVR